MRQTAGQTPVVDETDQIPPTETLDALVEGMPIVYGGNRITRVGAALAAEFRPGDRLVVVQRDGTLLRIPAADHALVDDAVAAARTAFAEVARCSDAQIVEFFAGFAGRLADDAAFATIAAANAADVDDARARGRSTTRLVLDAKMRAAMIAGLRGWLTQPAGRDALQATVEHPGWRVEQRRAPLGVVGFVFEGRPNVFADAAGVVRSGNTAVLRIGRDALGTARAIVDAALRPALADAGLPPATIVLLDAPSHAAGWALFAHPGLSLAVARGSGKAVAQLGAVARQTGTPVSLHGTGGGWLVAGEEADAERLRGVVQASLDRKVCNTLNVAVVLRSRAADHAPVILDALARAAAERGCEPRLHVTPAAAGLVPPEWLAREVIVTRPGGDQREPLADVIPSDRLGEEWEWENNPEITLAVVDDLPAAVELFNTHSPRLVASLVSGSPVEQDTFWKTVDAPFVGDGFTRWVDGQFALDSPELGLSNWQDGRLFARGGVLSGDGVHTVRLRAVQDDPTLHR